MAPKDVHIAILGTYDCYLTWPKGLGTCDLIRMFRWGDYTGLSKWAWCNHKGPKNREAEGQC